MGELIRNTNWSSTNLGAPDSWPDSLTSAISISLNSGFPIAIYWGSDFTLLYNDAWSSIPGQKHPWALGRPGAVVWPEIWEGLKEEFESVLIAGASYRRPDVPLFMHRHGYTEECYFDYTLSPIIARDGSVGGVFNAVVETTFKVIHERRTKIINQFIYDKNLAHQVNQAARYVLRILQGAQHDIPFFLLYTFTNEQPNTSELTAYAGISRDEAHAAAWPVRQFSDSRSAIHIENIRDYLPEPIFNVWPEPVQEALIVPISKDEAEVKGFMVIGASARKRIDAEYRYFMETIGMHTGTLLNNAYAFEISEAYRREQTLNEELATANEELTSINEELQQTQENLFTLNNELEERVAAQTAEVIAAQTDIVRERDRLKRFFLEAPAGICILAGPDLVFELVNKPYQQLFPGRNLIGKPMLEAIPEVKGQPVWDILQKVYTTGETFEGQELLIPMAFTDDGPVENRYFNFIYQARHDDQGQTDGILVFVFEVTDTVKSKDRIKESENNLRNLVMTSHYPLMILKGQELHVEIANQQLGELWNKPLEDIIGNPLLQILPELEGQPFPLLLKQVYDTGIPYGQEEEIFYINTPEGTITKYVSFYYDPLTDADGNVTGIIVAANDISDIVQSRKLLEESYEEQQTLNEEISAANEELAAANEELITTNEELYQTQQNLQETVSHLAESEERFRTLIQDAPVAIAMLRGPNFLIEAANTSILKLWGKTAGVIGSPLKDALPELQGQAFLPLLDEVYTSGITYHGNEAKTLLEQKGELIEGYVNFIYQPVKGADDHTVGIMVVAIDVSQQVNSRKALEQAQDRLRFAFKAAELGTFDMDLHKGTLFWDERCRTLFGINHQNEVSYEQDFVEGLHPDDRERILNVIKNTFIKSVSNGDYDVEYRTVGAEDHKLRWLRAKGKVYFDENDSPVRFVGAVLDITEQKLDDLRKNDFIGMVSHELKTPLTSLTAYIQVLLTKASKNEDKFTIDALNKANQQVKKMSAMINGFLNVSRLESGKIQLSKQDFLLNDLIKEMVEDTQLMVSSHTLNFLPCEPITLYADADKIGSVITNLLSNAVKYSPKGKNIEVDCRQEGNMAKVSVKDEGMGIKPQDKEKLFERYYRVESKHAKHISGFGIGLYLCAEIIQRHNGQIGVESEIGKGSTFWFTLPLSS